VHKTSVLTKNHRVKAVVFCWNKSTLTNGARNAIIFLDLKFFKKEANMANIEIHGGALVGGIGALEIKINEKIREIGMEAIITEVHSFPNSCNDPPKKKPFFRIYGETQEEIHEVVEVLRELNVGEMGFSVEIPPLLLKFIPEEAMVNSKLAIRRVK